MPRLRSICAVFAVIACCFGPRLAWAASHRADISEAFGRQLCGESDRTLPVAFWRLNIYDAQIDSEILTTKKGSKPTLVVLERRAKSLAHLRSAGGYAYGLCEGSTKGWVAALRAPEPLLKVGSDLILQLPSSALSTQCQTYRVDFAGEKSAHTQHLATPNHQVNLSNLEPGTLSVTCYPKIPQWRGPVLWFLVPVKTTGDTKPPASSIVTDDSATKDQTRALLDWVNQMRTDLKLRPVKLSPSLCEAASRLSVDRTVDHNRTMLRGSADLLISQDIKLIGEDRVMGHNLASMAWLLWFSPRHRDSLLAPEANLVGVHLTKAGTQTLAVLVFGQSSMTPGPRASGAPAHSSL